MSQCADILKALKRGRKITPLDALSQFGCYRLAARILDLRGMGYDIQTETITANGKKFARYSMR